MTTRCVITRLSPAMDMPLWWMKTRTDGEYHADVITVVHVVAAFSDIAL